MSKMTILSPYRKKKFQDIPKFSKDVRSVYLLPSAQANRILHRLVSNEAKVGFLVRRAYFRAKGNFYPIESSAKQDIRAAKKILGITASLNWSKYTSKVASHHRKLILEECQWTSYESKVVRPKLEEHASLFVDKLPDREEILFNLLDYCWRRRIEIPSYTEFSSIVSASFSLFNDKTRKRLSELITTEQRNLLLELITQPEISPRLSRLKNINQSTATSKMKQSADDLSFFKSRFLGIKSLADGVNLTPDAQKYFSKIVRDTTLPGLRKLTDKDDVAIKLLGFVQDQYISRNDAGILAVLKRLREWGNNANNHEKKVIERESQALDDATESVVAYVKTSDAILKEIDRLIRNKSLMEGERITKVQDLLDAYYEAINPNINNQVDAVANGLHETKNKTRRMQYLFRESIKMQRAVSPILKLLVIDTKNSDPKLTQAYQYFIDSNGDTKEPDAPLDFLSNAEKQLLQTQKGASFGSKYKVLLFLHIERAIRGKRLNFLYSYAYQPAHKLQIADKTWKERYEEYLRTSGLWDFRDGQKVLADVGKKTSEALVRTNQNIIANKNSYVTAENGQWKMEDYEADFDTTQYIPSLLSDSKKVLLYKALAELDDEIHFSDEFMIPSQIGAMTQIEKKYIYGVLISLGTNIGHRDLARASSLDEKALRDIDTKRFTRAKLDKVISIITKKIHSIDISKIYEDEENVIHSSSDGKKIVVAVDSLLANYSYKYYGKEQGISANSFVDNKQAFFHVNVLSSSDREAAYMIDGLVKARENIYEESQKDSFTMELDDEVFTSKLHRHSTDEFGYTDAAFSGLFFLNVSFAPRFKQIETVTLHGFEHKYTSSQSNLPIVPKSAVNKKLILENWDDILRFMATIKLGYASASTLFRMLSAKGDSALYKALKEFGKLLKTQFIYTYIDNVDLRKRIQKQLNRAELGQKFKAAIFHGRKGKVRVSDPSDADKSQACVLILQSIIVLWNYLYLKKYLKEISSKSERQNELVRFSGGSVIAWAHFNMGGTFDFEHLEANSFGIPLSQLFKFKVL